MNAELHVLANNGEWRIACPGDATIACPGDAPRVPVVDAARVAEVAGDGRIRRHDGPSTREQAVKLGKLYEESELDGLCHFFASGKKRAKD